MVGRQSFAGRGFSPPFTPLLGIGELKPRPASAEISHFKLVALKVGLRPALPLQLLELFRVHSLVDFVVLSLKL